MGTHIPPQDKSGLPTMATDATDVTGNVRQKTKIPETFGPGGWGGAPRQRSQLYESPSGTYSRVIDLTETSRPNYLNVGNLCVLSS